MSFQMKELNELNSITVKTRPLLKVKEIMKCESKLDRIL